MPTDKSDAREVLASYLRPINKGAAWNVLEAKDDAYWLPILDAMLAFATPLPEAVPAADLEQGARACLADLCDLFDVPTIAAVLRERSAVPLAPKAQTALDRLLAFRDAAREAEGFVLVHQLRASADIQTDEARRRLDIPNATTDRAQLMRKAADTIERLAATPQPGSGSGELSASLAKLGDRIEAGEIAGGLTRPVNGKRYFVVSQEQYERDVNRDKRPVDHETLPWANVGELTEWIERVRSRAFLNGARSIDISRVEATQLLALIPAVDAVGAEREACAKVAEDKFRAGGWSVEYQRAGAYIAAAIRARTTAPEGADQ